MTHTPPWRTPNPPKTPKKFRRKSRVTRTDHRGNIIHGTVLNPENHYYVSNGRRLVTVRWDHMHPWEKGHAHYEDELDDDTSGIFQFDTRHYDLHHLTHDQIALLRDVLGADMRPEAAKLLAIMPRLPE